MFLIGHALKHLSCVPFCVVMSYLDRAFRFKNVVDVSYGHLSPWHVLKALMHRKVDNVKDKMSSRRRDFISEV